MGGALLEVIDFLSFLLALALWFSHSEVGPWAT